jgi:hypothetical protein
LSTSGFIPDISPEGKRKADSGAQNLTMAYPYPYGQGAGRGAGRGQPQYNPYAPAGRGDGGVGRGQGRGQVPPQKQQDIDTLRQCFPKVDMDTLNALYDDMGFEETYKGTFVNPLLCELKISAIESMENSEVEATTQVSPEKKLTFLQFVFDKLNPEFIQTILAKYQWSVEASLDELLQAEEARSYQEEQHRYPCLRLALT